MRLKIIDTPFAVCKVRDYSQLDWTQDFLFIGKTDEENSLVCPMQAVPANAETADGPWRALRIEGTLDFALIGILSRLSTLLAQNGIGIFAVSTYNTDYILTHAENLEKAVSVLAQNGYEIL